jgi:uncharacterized protein (DUF849 family)
LEDVTLLPDGSQARGNAALVAAAADLIRAHIRSRVGELRPQE